MSLFQVAEPVATRLKAFIYGQTGTGKTITALSFPNPAVIDTEDGTLHYGKYKKFFVIRTRDINIVKSAVDELLNNPGDRKTFILDSFTQLYEALLSRWENKLKVKSGNPSYTLQPTDYKFPKTEIKTLTDKILSLDMNVIYTAHETVKYAKNKFMEIEGVKADAPEKLPHMFDVVLRLEKTADGQRIAYVDKDRTNTLPPSFDFSYEAFVEFMGIEGLNREPIVFNQKVALEAKLQRTVVVNFQGKEIKTAGVTAENLGIIQSLLEQVGEDKILEKLNRDYMIDSFLDLKNDEAQLFINDIQTIINNNKQ